MTTKTIGILGGMGPEATLDCFGKIIKNTPAQNDQEHLRDTASRQWGFEITDRHSDWYLSLANRARKARIEI